MPTGYTSIIEDNTTFKEFAMGCAKAFGACITMRDEPSDKEIPTFKPSTYHIDKIKEIEKDISELNDKTHEDLDIMQAKEIEEERARYNKYIDDARKTRANYNRILEQVKDWLPPTSEHEGLKAFMIEQLESSIKHDCGEDYYQEALDKIHPIDVDTYKLNKLESLDDSLRYHIKNNSEEIERVDGRNEWVEKLKESINE